VLDPIQRPPALPNFGAKARPLELADSYLTAAVVWTNAADLVYGSAKKRFVGRPRAPERMTRHWISRTSPPTELFVIISLAAVASVWAQPTRQAYTADHHFLIRLLSVPSAIRLSRYFKLRLAVYDGNNPQRQLSDVQVAVEAGMAHGMAEGFAHGMQSAPKVEMRDGVVTVSGLFFHMGGDWTVRVTVDHGGDKGTASFQLPCCQQ
jgi:hypothetical protein